MAGHAASPDGAGSGLMPVPSGGKFGSMQGNLSGIKDSGDFWLSRVPALYLAIERYREWVNWDKRVYLSFIRPGDVVLDVGANVGAHAVFFSHLVRASGRVLAFEPIPENVTAMRALLARRARFQNVTLVPSAVGDPDAAVRSTVITAPAGDLTQASRVRQSSGSWQQTPDVRVFDCPITSLDRDAAVRELKRVDFVKLDVEGGELDVLKGAHRMLARDHPLVYCEAYAAWMRSFGYSPHELLRYVASLGYQGARVISQGEVHGLGPNEDAPVHWFETSSDILFFAARHAADVARFDKRYGVRSVTNSSR